MPNDGHRPRTSHSITALNRFFNVQDTPPRRLTTADLLYEPPANFRPPGDYSHENTALPPTPECTANDNPESIFKRTFEMVERVAKRSNSRTVRGQRPDFAPSSMSSFIGNDSTTSSHGLHRRSSISSSAGDSIRSAKRIFTSLRQRRGAVSGPSGQTFSQAQRLSRHSEEMLHSHRLNLHAQTIQPGSGSGARAAAQQANLDRQQLLSAKQKQQFRADTPEDLMDVDSAYEAEDDRASSFDMGTRLGSWRDFAFDFDIERLI